MRTPYAAATLLFASLALVLAACGPTVNEVRMASAPPKPATCELDFLELEMKDVAPGGPLEILGHVMLSQHGVRDPLAPEYRAQVRPRACAMGGEAVGIMMTGIATPTALSAGGTTVSYTVVRKRPPPSAKASPPAKF
ncbi:MAG: hypothetical protein JWP87_6329 [Labilithrix sp.]|nr:hypothetical protein [Labilithrix sp.]